MHMSHVHAHAHAHAHAHVTCTCTCTCACTCAHAQAGGLRGVCDGIDGPSHTITHRHPPSSGECCRLGGSPPANARGSDGRHALVRTIRDGAGRRGGGRGRFARWGGVWRRAPSPPSSSSLRLLLTHCAVHPHDFVTLSCACDVVLLPFVRGVVQRGPAQSVHFGLSGIGKKSCE